MCAAATRPLKGGWCGVGGPEPVVRERSCAVAEVGHAPEKSTTPWVVATIRHIPGNERLWLQSVRVLS